MGVATWIVIYEICSTKIWCYTVYQNLHHNNYNTFAIECTEYTCTYKTESHVFLISYSYQKKHTIYVQLDDEHPFTLHAATSPPTIASIREETVKSVNITLEEPAEGSECVEDYIIQYEGKSVSTSGALSVVISDTVFCRVKPVIFNVSAVLRDGSAISGSESDFTLMGESKYSSILWFQVLLLHILIPSLS